MFFCLVFNGVEINVVETDFCNVLESVQEQSTVVALPDQDGCYFYYSWSPLRDFNYFACSSELFKDHVDLYL